MSPASFLLSQPQNVHAQSRDCSFSVPNIDGSQTLPAIYDWHHSKNRDHPVFTYVDQSNHIVNLTYADVVPASHRAGRYVMEACEINEDTVRPVVAIIASTTSTVTYFTTLVGLLLAAIPVLPVAPGNSPAAVAHLLQKTKVSHIFVSDDQPSRDLADRAVRGLTVENVENAPMPVIHTMPSFQQLYAKRDSLYRIGERIRDFGEIAVIVHSSGSTSFPKPIPWNHRSLLQTALMPHFGRHDLCKKVVACHAVAMHHSIGVNFVAWLPSTGLVMAVCDPEQPFPRFTSDLLFSELTKGPAVPDFVFAVPSFLEAWSEDAQKVSYLCELKGGLIYGGGPLAKPCGDRLAKSGVPIYTLYGASEVGVIATIFAENQGKDWEYFTINKQCAAEFVPDGSGTFELVVVAKPTQELSVTNTECEGKKAYATKDILTPHPTKPGFWKVVGRADDQIMLSTGEKTNPGPLEAILNEHPNVVASVIFGRGRVQNGVLVLLKEPHLSNLSDSSRVTEYRNSLWPNVEKMNSFAPAHSKIFQEMIIFARSNKPFVFTPKGAPKRPQILADYQSEIDELYRAVEDSAQHDIDVPQSWSTESSIEFVRTIVHRVLGSEIGDDRNIFELGCDSLNAIWIRNSILRGLRMTSKNVSRDVDLTFVYQCPTIGLLSQFILSAVHASTENLCTIADPIDGMQSFVTRFSTDFPVHTASESATFTKDVVLITGTTGSLGCAVLVNLIGCDSVKTIYALNRLSSSGKPLRQRQQQALEERGYSSSLVDCPKVILLEGDTSKPGLALEDATFKELRSSITHIIHIAWPVDFNLTLSSFEPAIIGLRNLVDLALSSPHQVPPQFVFASSIGVLNNWKSESPIREEFIPDAAVAVGQGYAESKWVSERILAAASEHTALHPVAVRIGQLSGTPSGAWNASDWFPLLLKSSITLGALPDLRGICNWLPVDVAAKALCDFRHAEHHVLHLVHPQPVPIESIMQTLSTEFHLQTIAFSEWIERLEKSTSSGQGTNIGPIPDARLQGTPALKILPFLREVGSKLDQYREEVLLSRRDSMGFPILDISKALRSSATLNDIKTSAITNVSALDWVHYWRRIGFL